MTRSPKKSNRISAGRLTRRQFAGALFAAAAAPFMGRLASAQESPGAGMRRQAAGFGKEGGWCVSFGPYVEEGGGRRTRINVLNPVLNYAEPDMPGQEKEVFIRLLDSQGRIAAESERFLLAPHQSRHLEARDLLPGAAAKPFLGSLRIYSRPSGPCAGPSDLGIQAADVDWYGEGSQPSATCHVMRDFVRAALRRKKGPRTRGLFTRVAADEEAATSICLQNLSLPPAEVAARPALTLYNAAGEALEALAPPLPPGGSARIAIEAAFPGAARHLRGAPGFLKIVDGDAPVGALGLVEARDGAWLEADHSFDEDFLSYGLGMAFVPLVEGAGGGVLLHIANPYDGAQAVRVSLFDREGGLAAERLIDAAMPPRTARRLDLLDLITRDRRAGFAGSAVIQIHALKGGRTIGLQCMAAEYAGADGRALVHAIYPPRDPRAQVEDEVELDLVQERVVVRGGLDTRIAVQHASPARGASHPLVVLANGAGKRIERPLPEELRPRGSAAFYLSDLFPEAEDLLAGGFGSIALRDGPAGPSAPLVAYLQVVDHARGGAALFTTHLIDRDYDSPYG